MDRLFAHLRHAPQQAGVFNPWWDVDASHDITPDAPQIRREHLRRYLAQRLDIAHILLVAEALGYQGGHFSGIPMTSERILLGGMTHKGIQPKHVMKAHRPRRTSRPLLRPNGFTEPTATIVWGHILNRGIDPFRVVLWNAFPWHPYHPNRGLLSNRTPTFTELEAGHQSLRTLIELGRFTRILAVGKRAQSQLQALNLDAVPVRHPANGGARAFQTQFDAAIT